MRNEINLFDVLLAKKLGGGGGTLIGKIITANGEYRAASEGAYGYEAVTASIPFEEKTATANSFSALTIPPYIAYGGATIIAGYANMTLGGDQIIVPIFFQNIGGVQYINGGIIYANNVGAVFCGHYTPGVAGVGVDYMGVIQSGAYQDMTAMASYVTDITISWYAIPSIA